MPLFRCVACSALDSAFTKEREASSHTRSESAAAAFACAGPLRRRRCRHRPPGRHAVRRSPGVDCRVAALPRRAARQMQQQQQQQQQL